MNDEDIKQIAHYDINQVVTVDKDILAKILNDDMLNNLLTVLGINDFNKWYTETIGGPAPFVWVAPSSFKFSRKNKVKKYHILDEIHYSNEKPNK